jgi:hypothetical protein
MIPLRVLVVVRLLAQEMLIVLSLSGSSFVPAWRAIILLALLRDLPRHALSL